MILTSIRMTTVHSGNRMVARASITLGGLFAIHGIKILKTEEGYFMAMPSRTAKPGRFEDVAHPVNAEGRAVLESLLYSTYEYLVDNSLHKVQMDVREDATSQSFLEQSFADFCVTAKKEDIPLPTDAEETEPVEEPSPEEEVPESKDSGESRWGNPFRNWFNS